MKNDSAAILQELSKIIKFYDPRDIGKSLNEAAYYRLFNLGIFASSWPESINSKIFLNHLDFFEIDYKKMQEAFSINNKTTYTNKDVTFFIRSYHGDFCWLKNVIQSIETFSNESHIVLCIEESDFNLLPKIECKQLKVVTEESFCAGTIQQKYSKLTADFHCDTEFIIYLDSDSALVRPFNLKDWLYFDKPLLEYTSYEDINNWFLANNIKGGNPEIWRKGVSAAVGYDVENEFSRRIEKIYRTSWLKDMRNHIEHTTGLTFKNFIAQQNGTKSVKDPKNALYFSDFNYMGSYLWKFKRSEIAWINTSILDYWTRKLCAVQFHSYTMTKKENGIKTINEIPNNFMQKTYSLWSSQPHLADESIFKEYEQLRSANRY